MMNFSPFLKIFCLLFVFAITLFMQITRLNELTRLSLAIPAREKELQVIHEEINRLRYRIELFYNPHNLMELARLPAYSHLKYPTQSEIIILQPVPVPLDLNHNRDLNRDLNLSLHTDMEPRKI